ncbi:hypothetical protein [Bergeyella sp. RCAD1439]|uniref:hypothetical protein n=1 Tax=Bergeyella anatis TaxID=3113737 RepID=UPI002E18D5EA|nr:hypothetical protein [Bergeyella sp. RCAD1439]
MASHSLQHSKVVSHNEAEHGGMVIALSANGITIRSIITVLVPCLTLDDNGVPL